LDCIRNAQLFSDFGNQVRTKAIYAVEESVSSAALWRPPSAR